ncbi:hypothetical protein [uncultured Culturomica sp.]|nr:hypothetical protein [uncultured Culturomica sp.]
MSFRSAWTSPSRVLNATASCWRMGNIGINVYGILRREIEGWENIENSTQ